MLPLHSSTLVMEKDEEAVFTCDEVMRGGGLMEVVAAAAAAMEGGGRVGAAGKFMQVDLFVLLQMCCKRKIPLLQGPGSGMRQILFVLAVV